VPKEVLVWKKKVCRNFGDLILIKVLPTLMILLVSKNHVFHKKRKSIDTRYNFIKELVNNYDIYLEFCYSKEQLTDIFTKPLARDNF
jgi:glucan phosphoethanolaminetransferase (alkaline phosphatase superfamily)